MVTCIDHFEDFPLSARSCMSASDAASIVQDVLSKFQGTWTLHPADLDKGGMAATRAVLEQDVLPVGALPRRLVKLQHCVIFKF